MQGLEQVETSTKVIVILFTATHKKKEILLKIENNTEGHSTAAKLTKIILDTLDMWNIEKHLIIGLVFDTASVNAGIYREVTACLEKAFGSFLLLECQHPVVEL